jgi:hypothetical protein
MIEDLLVSIRKDLKKIRKDQKKFKKKTKKEMKKINEKIDGMRNVVMEMDYKIERIDEIVCPSPLALLFTKQCRDIFETFIVGKLRPRSDLKFLNMAFKDARDAIERAKIKLPMTFNMRELSSISQLEFAWDNYHWDRGERSGTQKWFCYKVARMNKLEYLVWLREVKNCNWNSWTIEWAARQGNLAMVKYCVDNGCPMDAWTCLIAASEGHLDVLKYLHENDCPWSSEACYRAHENNHIDCLNYLIEQKFPGFKRYV